MILHFFPRDLYPNHVTKNHVTKNHVIYDMVFSANARVICPWRIRQRVKRGDCISAQILFGIHRCYFYLFLVFPC